MFGSNEKSEQEKPFNSLEKDAIKNLDKYITDELNCDYDDYKVITSHKLLDNGLYRVLAYTHINHNLLKKFPDLSKQVDVVATRKQFAILLKSAPADDLDFLNNVPDDIGLEDLQTLVFENYIKNHGKRQFVQALESGKEFDNVELSCEAMVSLEHDPNAQDNSQMTKIKTSCSVFSWYMTNKDKNDIQPVGAWIKDFMSGNAGVYSKEYTLLRDFYKD